jgi:uncharacterized double-CXXCG motif protein
MHVRATARQHRTRFKSHRPDHFFFTGFPRNRFFDAFRRTVQRPSVDAAINKGLRNGTGAEVGCQRESTVNRMRLFALRPDDQYPHNYYINAAHRWGLPGVECDVCGWVGATASTQYPHINLPIGLDAKPYQTHWPVRPEQLHKLIAPIRALLPPEFRVGAGTQFGPLVGKASGKFGDFTWLNIATPLISGANLERIAKEFPIEVVRPEIQLRSRKPFEFFELVILPHVSLSAEIIPRGGYETCPGCGIWKMYRDKSDWADRPVINTRDWPKDLHIARVRELPGIIAVTEALKHFLEHGIFTDVSFRELRTQ